jgi:hypothetical protein
MDYSTSRRTGTGERMAHYLGKFLEINGLLVLGVGLIGGIFGGDLAGEMKLLGLGAVVFVAGYVLERKLAGHR